MIKGQERHSIISYFNRAVLGTIKGLTLNTNRRTHASLFPGLGGLEPLNVQKLGTVPF